MTNRSEQGISHPERFTRREAFSRITGFVATALVLAGGCAEVELPQGVQPGTKPQVMIGLQTQEPPMQIGREDAEKLAGAVSLTVVSLFLLFLAGRRNRVKRNP